MPWVWLDVIKHGPNLNVADKYYFPPKQAVST
jgi:hypothetical protein